MRLAANFTLAELTATTHRAHLEENAAPPTEVVLALGQMATVLQRIRGRFQAPVVISSAYRCQALNAAVGGSSTSQHMRGEAADFRVLHHDLEEVWRWIWQESSIGFGQAILEGWVAGSPSWIHLSLGAPFRTPARCGEVLTWSRKTGYTRVDRGQSAT